MRIYPDDNLAREEDWDTSLSVMWVSDCERAINIIRNELNSDVVYRVADYFYMEVRQRASAPWRQAIVRRYRMQWPVGEWAIVNYGSTISRPNVQCPICGYYNTVSEYSGVLLLNITCTGCVEPRFCLECPRPARRVFSRARDFSPTPPAPHSLDGDRCTTFPFIFQRDPQADNVEAKLSWACAVQRIVLHNLSVFYVCSLGDVLVLLEDSVV